ncbi:MAG: hypothetical protein WC943_03285 [Elusimicrobiota bacterium]|jgi:hypothetical protein
MDLYLARGAWDRPWNRPEPRPRYLCFDWESFAGLRGQGAQACAWEDFIPAEAAAAADPLTESLSESWHRWRGEDFTLFEGVSLGKAYRWVFYALTIRPAVKFLLGLEAAIAEHRPATIWCESTVPPLHRRTLEAMAVSSSGWKVETVASQAKCSEVLVWRLPDQSLGQAKRLGLSLTNLLAKARRLATGPRPVIIASYYPSLRRFFGLAAESGAPFRLLFTDSPDRRMLPGLAAAGAEVLLDHRTEPALSIDQKALFDRIHATWEKLRKDPAYQRSFAFQGTSLWRAVEPVLEGFFRDDAPRLAWAAAKLDAAWERERPVAALLPFDEPPMQHLVTDVARKHGTPTITVLHGLPEPMPQPFGGGNAATFSAWGPTLREFYKGPGSLRDRTCIAEGNPYFDNHASVRPPAPPSQVRNILVLTFPPRNWIMTASELEPQLYAETVRSALRDVDAAITLKLHPCESLPYYLKLLGSTPGIEIVKDRPIMDCLLKADAVIGPYSTTLLEAVILNKPVLLVNLTKAAFPPPFDGRWGVEPLRSAEQLLAEVRRLLADPGEAIPRICRPYGRLLDEFTGPLDGKASERLLRTLQELASAAPRARPSRDLLE